MAWHNVLDHSTPVYHTAMIFKTLAWRKKAVWGLLCCLLVTEKTGFSGQLNLPFWESCRSHGASGLHCVWCWQAVLLTGHTVQNLR